MWLKSYAFVGKASRNTLKKEKDFPQYDLFLTRGNSFILYETCFCAVLSVAHMFSDSECLLT